MGILMAMMMTMGMAIADAKDDAIKTMVLGFLSGYLGIATGTAFLFEGVKMSVPKIVTGRENILVLLLTFVLGSLAKWLIPSVYGETDTRAWVLHLVSLVFVAILGMMFHDKLMDAVKALLKKVSPGVDDASGDGDSSKGGSE
jgi:hypothetical protein